MSHVPVMLEECMQSLNIKEDGVYFDGTFGRGGHSAAILEALGPDGQLHACDRDPEAIRASEAFTKDRRFTMHDAEHSHMKRLMDDANLCGHVDGILLDLGVSSPQLDEAHRGFSLMQDGPLDMRMDPRQGQPVAQWLNTASEEAIADVLFHYGHERRSRRIAQSIVQRRSEQPFETTKDLATHIERVMGRPERNKHPATRSFLALRLWVNQESKHLEQLLCDVPDVLASGGRLVVLTFHSQEAQVAKRALKTYLPGGEDRLPAFGMNLAQIPKSPRLRRVGRMAASDAEITRNPRARSAICRVWEKVA